MYASVKPLKNILSATGSFLISLSVRLAKSWEVAPTKSEPRLAISYAVEPAKAPPAPANVLFAKVSKGCVAPYLPNLLKKSIVLSTIPPKLLKALMGKPAAPLILGSFFNLSPKTVNLFLYISPIELKRVSTP